MRKLLVFLLAYVSIALPAFCEDVMIGIDIGGRVCDHMNKPVPGTKVRLKDATAGTVLSTASTDSDGQFSFKQPKCSTCALEIIPSPKKTLETALINGIPGDKTRQFAVRLEHGFALHGRVVHRGKPLKGLSIRALPADLDTEKGTIHGGGWGTTDGAGRFTLILTPGQKLLTIYNDKYPSLTSKLTHTITVIADKNIPDIELYEAAKLQPPK
jgi:hypothetical protein